jgi:hypothetical protein
MKRIRENRTDLSIPGNRPGYDEPDHRLKGTPRGEAAGRDRMVTGRDGKLRPSGRADTGDRDRQIHALRDAGKSLRAIAAEVKCSVGTVVRVLKS